MPGGLKRSARGIALVGAAGAIGLRRAVGHSQQIGETGEERFDGGPARQIDPASVVKAGAGGWKTGGSASGG
jgi:hypothetical protein